MATHSSILAWRIPGTGEPGGLPSMGSHRVGHNWSNVAAATAVAKSCSTLLWPHGLWPSRLLYPWDFPGKNTRVVCHFLPRISSGPKDWTHVSCIGRQILCHWATTLLCQSVSSVAQSCLTLCDATDCSMPGFHVHHQLLEFIQTHVHWVGDAIQLSPPLSPSPHIFNLSQHQGLYKWVSSSHQVAKVLEFQLKHQSFQWIFRTDFL